MEMDLAPYIGVVFDIVVFTTVFGMSSAFGVAIWFFNRNGWRELGSTKVLLQALARSWLDTGLIAGIFGTSVGVMAVINSADFADIDNLYRIMPIVLGTFLWGGLLTGLGYCLLDLDSPIKYKIKPSHILPISVIFLACLFHYVGQTGKPVVDFLTSYSVSYYASILLCIMTFVAIWYRDKRPIVVIANNANLVATLGGMAMGISLWFVEGADYEASKDAIYFIANILMLGSLVYLFLYLLSLLFERSGECNYQTKSWHFAEATAFFLFLVYAPVGTTEYLRESTDQANQKLNNEAQELRIEQLEAQIKLLSEKIGEARDTY